MNKDNRGILACLVRDEPGVLGRIVSVIRRRGYNIASLAVGHSEQPDLSRMIIVIEAVNSAVREQARKQLEKLIDVIEVKDVTEENIVSRELSLITVKTTPATRGEIIMIADIFRANIVDVASESLIVEVTGAEERIDVIIRLFKDFGVQQVIRTGCLAACRGHVND